MINLPGENHRLFWPLFLMVLALGLALRGWIAVTDMNILLDHGLVQDDAYYYYVIARNILDGGMASFDGINPTNGFHPLWQVICLPVFAVFDGDTAVRVMLLIAVLCDLAALLLLYLVISKLVANKWFALLGMGLLATHGAVIRTTFNGLETSLSLCLLLLFLWQFLRIYSRKSETLGQLPGSLRDHLLLGVIAAFAFLARTDNAVIVVVCFVFLYVPAALRGQLRSGVLVSLLIVLLVSPWLLWNLHHFGNIVQISGQIHGDTYLTYKAKVDHPFHVDLVRGTLRSINPVGNIFKKLFIPTGAKPILGYLFLLPILIALFVLRRKDAYLKQHWHYFLPFVAGVIVLFLYHAGVRQFLRGWYNAPAMVTTIIVLCLLCESFVRTRMEQAQQQWHGVSLIFVLPLLIAVIVFHSPYRYLKPPKVAHIDPRVGASLWLNENSSPDTIVGAANAGIVGYYTQRPVINLDGVVNENAHKARLKSELHRYIHESSIDYIADHKGSIAHLCAENSYYTCKEMDNWQKSTYVMRVIRKP